MASSGKKSDGSRESLLRRLLHGASPRNPTYVLSRILLNFRAQSSTELTVSSSVRELTGFSQPYLTSSRPG